MFLILPTNRCYYSNHEQKVSGLFLVLCQPAMAENDFKISDWHAKYPPRAFIKSTTMRQVGPWMMSTLIVEGHKIHLSGTYGNEGLTRDVPMSIYEKAIPIPPELIEAWNKGGGHNSAGSEGPLLEEWAFENLLNNHSISHQYLSAIGSKSFPNGKRPSHQHMMSTLRGWRRKKHDPKSM